MIFFQDGEFHSTTKRFTPRYFNEICQMFIDSLRRRHCDVGICSFDESQYNTDPNKLFVEFRVEEYQKKNVALPKQQVSEAHGLIHRWLTTTNESKEFYRWGVKSVSPFDRSLGLRLAKRLANALPRTIVSEVNQVRPRGDAIDIPEDFMEWQLPDGHELTCWVGGEFVPTEPVLVWADTLEKRVKFRVKSGRTSVLEWQTMKREKGKSANPFLASISLRPGSYSIDFLVSGVIHSAVKFRVQS